MSQNTNPFSSSISPFAVGKYTFLEDNGKWARSTSERMFDTMNDRSNSASMYSMSSAMGSAYDTLYNNPMPKYNSSSYNPSALMEYLSEGTQRQIDESNRKRNNYY